MAFTSARLPSKLCTSRGKPSRPTRRPKVYLGFEPPLLAHATFAAVIFLLYLEVKGRDTIEQKRELVGTCTPEAGSRQDGAVIHPRSLS